MLKIARYLALTLLVVIGCNKTSTSTQTTTLNSAQKIAAHYGIKQWQEVNKLAFTFNVERPNRKTTRRFIWHIKEDSVEFFREADTIRYQRHNLKDSLFILADRYFVNDSYWLLAPFKLVTDRGTSLSKVTTEQAPISKDSLQKITLKYDSTSGGYTPGDAYDFYFDSTYTIKEWAFRKDGQPNPSLITSWEAPISKNGLKFTVNHSNPNNFSLYFTDISWH